MTTFLRLTLAALWLALTVASAVAQDAAQIDYDQWQTVATRAEQAVEDAEASDDALSDLRLQIVEWREQFQSQLNANNSRLQTLNDQLNALGAAPEEGQTEPEEIAARRDELNAQIERLSTPRRSAEEAFSRANGIIDEIDDILRQRQADELLQMGPWPINPAIWPGALEEARTAVVLTYDGVRESIANPVTRAETRDNLPLIIALLVVGIALLARARYWVELLASRIQNAEARSGTGAMSFFVSLGQILLPMMGLFAILRAIGATDLYGPRAGVILDALEPMGLAIFFALWLGSRIFPKDEALPTPLTLSPGRRSEGRLYAFTLGLIFALHLLVERVADYETFAEETRAVLQFPLVLLAGLLIIRMGWLLRRNKRAVEEDTPADRAFGARIIRLLGQAAIAVGVVAPVLAALGYTVAAIALIYPAILTLALFATVALLQQLVRDIYAAIKPQANVSESLVPTLAGFLLVLIAGIPLSLIWGARVTDLLEVWMRVRTGLTIGDTTISPTSFLTLIIVFVIGYMLTRGAQAAMKTSVLPKTRIDAGGQVAIVSGLGYVGIFLAALIAITAAGLDLSSLAIVAGALSVGIGFGLQTVVSNFVSGIILLIERPIAEGDWIEVGGQMGYVRNISVRSTRIETFDRTDVIVPNADLISGTVTNFTRGNTVGRVIIPVGVAYGTDTRRVDTILREIAEAHPMALANPPPNVIFMGFGADSLDFEIRIILRDVNFGMGVRNELNHQIAERFTAEGIEIPFAQRDIWLRNPEALREQPKEAGAGDTEAPATPVDDGPQKDPSA